MLVAGSAGLGSTRFVDEAIRRIADLPEPMTVLRGRVTRGPDAPYAPLVRALRPVLTALDDATLGAVAGPAGEDLVRLLPELEPRLAPLGRLPARPTTTVPERRQARALEGVLGILGRLGERQPVVLVLEDVHRADAATRAALTFLVRIARAQRLAIVATYHGDEIPRGHPFAGDLPMLTGAPRPPLSFALEPLGRDELARLIEDIEGERPSASVLLLVAERSGGRPLAAEELLAARRELSTVSPADAVEDLINARLAIRGPECRRVLRLLALAGRRLRSAELAAVADAFERGAQRRPPRSGSAPRRSEGILDADLAAGLDEAVEHGFIVRDEEAIDFRHELIAAAVDADLLPFSRVRYHAALATALEERPEIAARHWLAAHRIEEARAAFLTAADRASAAQAPADELAALEAALALGPDRPDVTALKERAAEAAFAAGQASRAIAFAEAAIAALDGRRERVRLGLLHERLGHYRRAAGDGAGAMAARRRAVELVPREPSPERATVLAALAQLTMLEGTFSSAERLAREAIRVARACGPVAAAQEAAATTTLGVTLGWSRDPASAIELLHEAGRMALELGDLDERFRVLANLTTVYDVVGRWADAVNVATDGIAEARAVGLEAVYGNFLRGNAADSLFLLGRWDEARAAGATSLEWLPVGINFLNSIVNLATVEIERSAGEEAGRLLGQTLLELEAVRDSQLAVPFYLASASFALWRGDSADALRAAERGWELVRGTEDWVLATRMAATATEVDSVLAAEAHGANDLPALAAARARAPRVLAEAEEAVRRHGAAPSTGSRQLAEAFLATARAFVARTENREEPAAWAEVAERWGRLAAPYEIARARWRQAEAELVQGGQEGRAVARRPLLEATGIALELGARPLLREIRELATRARIRLPDSVDTLLAADGADEGGPVAAGGGEAVDGVVLAPSSVARVVVGEVDGSPSRGDTFGLSSREREVLVLISQGRTNREIGERLFITPKTVGVHVGNILAKLGVSGRVEAAAVAIRLGLTERR